MLQERRRWSIVSKSPRGMYLLDADLKAEMRREGKFFSRSYNALFLARRLLHGTFFLKLLLLNLSSTF